MANIIGKSVVGGVFAATLAMPCSAQTSIYLQFGTPPVSADPYNALLGATSVGPVTNGFGSPSVDPYNASLGASGLLSGEIASIEVRFSGPMIYVDPYNSFLAGAVPPASETVRLDDPNASFAFAPGYLGARVWEGSSDK